MEELIENLIAYALIFSLAILVLLIYLRKNKRQSYQNYVKLKKAKETGLHEPVSLHPVINLDVCIGSGACVKACPEKDILGLINGKAATINASRCVGHGACFHACPVQAITLCIGTEKRGVVLPHISQEFETNIPGIYIAGELGGMGLIKNAVEQGKQAIEFFSKKMKHSTDAKYDIIIVGAGPAGISASLTAAKLNLKFLTLEQDTIGGTVMSFPRAKIVMTSPMDLPLWGRVKLFQTNKTELIELWKNVLEKNKIRINEEEKVEKIERVKDYFIVTTNRNRYSSNGVLLAIGRRGSPRKLGVPGENKEKVYYRLLEPELIRNKEILVVGGGDAAIESAMLLADESNKVSLSYRGENFARLKPLNYERINHYIKRKKINVIYNSTVKEIFDDFVELQVGLEQKLVKIKNDLVYVFIGGILPTAFLESIGIKITKKYGEAILKHE